MQATADALAFAPPPEPAAVRGFVLAVIAHLLLVVALSLGINWDKDTTPAAVEAELWAALPQEAAPPPQPEPQVIQAPPVVQAPPPPVTKEPDIAIERDKKRKEQEAKRHEEEERKKAEAQQRRLEEERRLADEKKMREELAKKEKAKQELDAKKREQLRKEQIARMQALAGSGSPTAQGSAASSKGPSASYAAKIAGRIKPNIVFGDVVGGNPAAVVHLRVAPDGTIVGRKLVKSSGINGWDEAVLRAIDKTEHIPRDTDGRVVPEFDIEFKPKD